MITYCLYNKFCDTGHILWYVDIFCDTGHYIEQCHNTLLMRCVCIWIPIIMSDTYFVREFKTPLWINYSLRLTSVSCHETFYNHCTPSIHITVRKQLISVSGISLHFYTLMSENKMQQCQQCFHIRHSWEYCQKQCNFVQMCTNDADITVTLYNKTLH